MLRPNTGRIYLGMPDFLPIQEASASELLRNAAGTVADRLRATRRDGGWSFAWDPADGEPPMGESRWTVADNGAVRRLIAGQTVADALRS